jgi:predicted amidohydrolase YtcJ
VNNDNRSSRRSFIGTVAGAGIGIAAGAPDSLLSAQAPQAAPAAPAAAQDLNLVNGRIHTLDARNSVVSAVAIRNGRIASVGNNAPPRTANTRVIDLRGRTVVPGLIEGHVHIVSLANRPGYHTILENTTSIREIQEALAARRKSVPEGQWITSMGGWHTNQWAEHRYPTLKELDEAVPDRPVLLYERFTGPAITNSAGKKILDALDAGRTAASRDQEGRGRRQRSDRRSRIRRRWSFRERAVSSAPHADLRGQEAQHR